MTRPSDRAFELDRTQLAHWRNEVETAQRDREGIDKQITTLNAMKTRVEAYEQRCITIVAALQAMCEYWRGETSDAD